jgi:hypothetical protein
MKGEQVKDEFCSKDGEVNGLILKLYVASVDDIYSFASKRGAYIYIENKTSGIVFSNGYDVNVNTETSLVVRKEYRKAEPSPFSDCVADLNTYGSIFTNMFRDKNLGYSQKGCFL